MSEINILHLSDLHFGMEPDPEFSVNAIALRENTLNALTQKLQKINKSRLCWKANKDYSIQPQVRGGGTGFGGFAWYGNYI